MSAQIAGMLNFVDELGRKRQMGPGGIFGLVKKGADTFVTHPAPFGQTSGSSASLFEFDDGRTVPVEYVETENGTAWYRLLTELPM